MLLQHVGHQHAHAVVVFDQQHRFRSAAAAGFGGGRLSEVGGARQVDVERRAAAHLALHFDGAAALLHDAVHRGQAEARALAVLLGREERFEDARRRLRVHAGAGIADRHLDVVARLSGRDGRPRRSCRARCFSARSKSVPPEGMASRAFTTRFTRICSTCVRSASTGVRPGHTSVTSVHVLADQPLQHVLRFLHQLIQRHGLLRDHLPSAEGEQLARQAGGAVRGLEDFIGVHASARRFRRSPAASSSA